MSSAEANLGAWPLPSGLHERVADDQPDHQPENERPHEDDRPVESGSGRDVRAASERLIHWPSIAYRAVVITVGLAQLAWIILLIYATYWLLAIRL